MSTGTVNNTGGWMPTGTVNNTGGCIPTGIVNNTGGGMPTGTVNNGGCIPTGTVNNTGGYMPTGTANNNGGCLLKEIKLFAISVYQTKPEKKYLSSFGLDSVCNINSLFLKRNHIPAMGINYGQQNTQSHVPSSCRNPQLC